MRLDNNSVEPATVPLQKGFQGTLAVDVSGWGGAMLRPGMTRPDSKSVVIWDVPRTVQEEGGVGKAVLLADICLLFFVNAF